MEVSGQLLGLFISGETASGTHWIGGWVGPRAGMDDVERRRILSLSGLELRPLDPEARGQSVCRLRYHGYRLRTGGNINVKLYTAFT
jgi:hypothetical protein